MSSVILLLYGGIFIIMVEENGEDFLQTSAKSVTAAQRGNHLMCYCVHKMIHAAQNLASRQLFCLDFKTVLEGECGFVAS